MLLVVAVDANVDIAQIQTIIIQSWQCLSFNISELI